MAATIEERVAKIEGEMGHMATKADLAQMEMRLLVRLGGLIVAAVTVAAVVERVLG